MVAHMDNSLVRNIVLGTTRDQLLKVKKFEDTIWHYNSICQDNFILGRRGRVVVISYGPLKTLVLALENIQGISTEMLSSYNHKVMRTFLFSS